jgi:hypothetical protein
LAAYPPPNNLDFLLIAIAVYLWYKNRRVDDADEIRYRSEARRAMEHDDEETKVELIDDVKDNSTDGMGNVLRSKRLKERQPFRSELYQYLRFKHGVVLDSDAMRKALHRDAQKYCQERSVRHVDANKVIPYVIEYMFVKTDADLDAEKFRSSVYVQGDRYAESRTRTSLRC